MGGFVNEYTGLIVLDNSRVYCIIRGENDARRFFEEIGALDKTVEVIKGDIRSIAKELEEFYKKHKGTVPDIMPKEMVIDLIG